MRDPMIDAADAHELSLDGAPSVGGEAAGRDREVGTELEGAVRDVLRDRGLRYSRPREAILAFMAEEPRHVSAESLYQSLRERGEDLSLSTVYLNLGVLVEAGLLREFKGAQGESLYDASVEPHDHLICRETGEVVDVPMPVVEGVALPEFLRAHVERVTGWTVDEVHLSLRGRPKRSGGEAN
ncbi:MAG: transcriptional repressor [Trueperaceae bacterium]|nr:transcriptional repressor [Trueperaceae bacterium]